MLVFWWVGGVLMGFDGFYWVLLGFDGFCSVLLGYLFFLIYILHDSNLTMDKFKMSLSIHSAKIYTIHNLQLLRLLL